MTKAQLKKIKCPTLILAGDDEPFSTEHTASLYEAIPSAQLAILPGTSHAVLKENISKSDRNIVFIIRKICSNNNNKNG